MLAGNSPAMPDGPFARGQPLTALIATDLGEAAVPSDRYHALYAAGLALLVAIVLVNLAIFALKRRFR